MKRYLKGFHHGRAHPSGHVSTGEEEAKNLIRNSVGVPGHVSICNQSHKDSSYFTDNYAAFDF